MEDILSDSEKHRCDEYDISTLKEENSRLRKELANANRIINKIQYLVYCIDTEP